MSEHLLEMIRKALDEFALVADLDSRIHRDFLHAASLLLREELK